MKIVFVLHFRLDRNAGAAGVLLALTDQFRAAGHQVSAISHDGLGRLPLIVRNLLFPFYSAAMLALHHTDADVIEGATGDCWLYYLARMRNRTTLYVTFSHGLYRPLHDRLMREKAAGRAKVSWKYRLFHGSLELWQEAFSMRMADLVYVLNADEKRFATDRLKIDPARISIVKNGLGEQFRRRAASVRSAAPRQKRLGIVQVGSYEERKGIKVSVTATTRLLEANPELHMAFFGTVRPAEQTLGDYPDHLRSRVTVLPRFDNARLPDLLADYDMFIMPSTYEGFGIAPLEAMACGLVPIVTNIAGPAEYIVDGWNGLVIPVDSADALEEALSRLINDAELYATLRAGALDTVEKFGWDDVAQARLRDYALYGSRKKGHAVEDIHYAKSVEM